MEKVLKSKDKGSGFVSTFNAVFLPVSITLLSVVLFLRLGQIVGITGFWKTTLVVSFSALISLLTAFSISSVSTNMKIESGGLYYILGRTFGIEASSAICIPLFIAQCFTIAFCISGFSEAISLLFCIKTSVTFCLLILVLLTSIALYSEKFVVKAQTFLFIIVGLGLISFFIGNNPSNLELVDSGKSLANLSFWPLVALFFPAVTGIEGGLAMTSRLDPAKKSVPKGMISALIIAYVVYITCAFLLSTRAPSSILISNPLIMRSLAYIPQVLTFTICLSTLSGALSMLLAAPRVLEALSNDGVLPKFFSKSFGESDTPQIAILATSLIAYLGLTFGDLNQIAPMLTMFFLASYCMINLSTGIEAMIANPSWRPTFPIPWALSLTGAVCCFVTMLMTNAGMTLTSFSFICGLYFFIKRKQLSSKWDDLRHSILILIARFATYKLDILKSSPKSWRPSLLVFVGDPLLRPYLICLSSQLTHKKGLLTYSSLIDNTLEKSYEVFEKNKLELFLRKLKIPAIVHSARTQNIGEKMQAMIENFGMGSLSPNTIVLGAPKKKEKYPIFAKVIFSAFEHQKNILLVHEPSSKGPLKQNKDNKIIDVWWAGGSKNNPELTLTLAYMLKTSSSWKGAKLKLKTAVTTESDEKPLYESLQELARSARLNIHPEIVMHDLKQSLFQDTIKQSSKDADLIFLGLRPPSVNETVEDYCLYFEDLIQKVQGFKTTLFVLCSENLDFDQILN